MSFLVPHTHTQSSVMVCYCFRELQGDGVKVNSAGGAELEASQLDTYGRSGLPGIIVLYTVSKLNLSLTMALAWPFCKWLHGEEAWLPIQVVVCLCVSRLCGQSFFLLRTRS